jgi:hypothetical protein
MGQTLGRTATATKIGIGTTIAHTEWGTDNAGIADLAAKEICVGATTTRAVLNAASAATELAILCAALGAARVVTQAATVAQPQVPTAADQLSSAASSVAAATRAALGIAAQGAAAKSAAATAGASSATAVVDAEVAAVVEAAEAVVIVAAAGAVVAVAAARNTSRAVSTSIVSEGHEKRFAGKEKGCGASPPSCNSFAVLFLSFPFLCLIFVKEIRWRNSLGLDLCIWRRESGKSAFNHLIE